MDQNHDYQIAAQALREAKKILLVAHRRPDGDTLGANLALHYYLKSLGASAQREREGPSEGVLKSGTTERGPELYKKETVLACIDAPSERFAFLPDVHRFTSQFHYSEFDLIVMCDAGDRKMSGFHEIIPEFLSNQVPILNIDHHISNDRFGRINVVEPTSASATAIVFKLLKYMNAVFSREMALCLMTGLYNDTGSFMHSNTSLEVFQIAAELMKTGVDSSVIVASMFRQKRVPQLKLWGKILERLKVNRRKVLSSVLTLEDIHASGASSDDTGGIIDLMSTVAEADFSVLIAEDEKGFVKGSFRTQKNDIDVAEIAAQFGGGGHKKAAGFRIPGKLNREVVWTIESPEVDGLESHKKELRF